MFGLLTEVEIAHLKQAAEDFKSGFCAVWQDLSPLDCCVEVSVSVISSSNRLKVIEG